MLDTQNHNSAPPDIQATSEHVSDQTIAFEIRAFESVLDTVVHMHSQEFKRHAVRIRDALGRLKARSIVPVGLQEKMRHMKNGLSSITARINAHRRALEEILEEDEEMAMMNLSKFAEDPANYRYLGA